MVFSVASFLVRGFSAHGLALDNPASSLAAIKAVTCLLIEISFIATFTQRSFGAR
jgi:hypothetical protein